jgi:hypothetical protein
LLVAELPSKRNAKKAAKEAKQLEKHVSNNTIPKPYPGLAFGQGHPG